MKVPIALDPIELAVLLTVVQLGLRTKEAVQLPIPLLELLSKTVDKLIDAGKESIEGSERAR